MSGLRGRSAVAADHRSALPQIPGIPWWGAAIVAIAWAAIGFAIDAGSGNLGGAFVSCYVIGCVLAVLAVRQSGVFTAVIQPPLILFVVVPFAYFVFHGSTFTGIKDALINYGYPLIERFPLMFFTSATVLLIGMVRWFIGAAARRSVPADAEPAVVDATATELATPATESTSTRRGRRSTSERPSRTAAAAATAATVTEDTPRPSRRSTRTAAPAASKASSADAGTASRRSRHSLPPEAETIDPAASRPRRRNAPPVDPTAEPRRRTRSAEAREPRERREPSERREPRERRPLPPLDRRNAYERPERSERPQRSERTERPQRRPRVTSDYEPHEPPPTSRTNGNSGTHHPISRVRYRGTEDGESRTEHRTRPRPSRHAAPESWQYDV